MSLACDSVYKSVLVSLSSLAVNEHILFRDVQKEAAGTFNTLKEHSSQHPEGVVSEDLSYEALSALTYIMLAQAQECVFTKVSESSVPLYDNTVHTLTSKSTYNQLTHTCYTYLDTVFFFGMLTMLAWPHACFPSTPFPYTFSGQSRTSFCWLTRKIGCSSCGVLR